MSQNKFAYFQGGGGVNEPTPGKKKYKSDPALVVQPRFKEPFYRNYDLYKIPGMEDIGPGTGHHGLQNYKSVQEFLEERRKRLKPRYVADDSWQMDNGKRIKKNPNKQARTAILERIIKEARLPGMSLINQLHNKFKGDDNADNMLSPKEHGTSIYDWRNSPYQGTPGPKKKDVNNIDFPIDEQVNRQDQMIYPEEDEYQIRRMKGFDYDFPSEGSPLGPENLNISMTSPQIAGEHSYLPDPDFEGKPDNGSQLDFGRDYTENDEFPGVLNEDDLAELANKYLEPAETDLFGLPDGMDPISDLDPNNTMQIEQPYTGPSDISGEMYEDKWNI